MKPKKFNHEWTRNGTHGKGITLPQVSRFQCPILLILFILSKLPCLAPRPQSPYIGIGLGNNDSGTSFILAGPCL